MFKVAERNALASPWQRACCDAIGTASTRYIRDKCIVGVHANAILRAWLLQIDAPKVVTRWSRFPGGGTQWTRIRHCPILKEIRMLRPFWAFCERVKSIDGLYQPGSSVGSWNLLGRIRLRARDSGLLSSGFSKGRALRA